MELGIKDSQQLLNTNIKLFKYIPKDISEYEILKLQQLVRKSYICNRLEIHDILEDLFLGLIVDQNIGCWYIDGNWDNYRQLTVKNKKGIRAHRLSYEIFIGNIVLPQVCHHCDRPGCCNPLHLFNGTQASNTEDARLKGRLNRKINLTESEKFLLWKHINTSNYHKVTKEIEITERAKNADEIFGIKC